MPALTKQPVAVNFAKGIDTKSDPFQIPIGNYFYLINSVFTKQGLLSKRNGFGLLPTPADSAEYLATFNNNLVQLGGNSISALSVDNTKWVDPQPMPQVSLSTLSLIRDSFSQAITDSAVSPNNLTCLVYVDNVINTAGTQEFSYNYVVVDSNTGQTVIVPTQFVVANVVNAPTTIPRVFLLGTYFIICYVDTTNNFYYIAINIATLAITGPVSLSNSATDNFPLVDGIVYNNLLYLVWNDSAAGIHLTTLSPTLVQGSTVLIDATHTNIGITVASDTNVIWVSYIDATDRLGYSTAIDATALTTILAPTVTISVRGTPAVFTPLTMASLSSGGTLTIYCTQINSIGYDPSILSFYIDTNTVTTGGVVGTQSVFIRSVAVASKAFVVNGMIYLAGLYQSPDQSTLFLLDGNAQVVSRFAYTNAGTYNTIAHPSGAYYLWQSPAVTLVGDVAYFSYLLKTTIEDINESGGGNPPVTTTFYSTNGVNQIAFNFDTVQNSSSVEIGNNLNISGGFLWGYDGLTATENNFFLFPDQVEAAAVNVGSGNIAAGTYFYQVVYEWEDKQGNIFRSTPSIPTSVTLTSSSNIDVSIPMLRLTYKTGVRITIYRWSTAQPIFYEINVVGEANNPTLDSITVLDQQPDSFILGNPIIYTNGGVLENTGAPSPSAITIFDNRLWMINAEDPNQMWYSQPMVEDVPVEMSDLLTFFVAPSVGSQGPVGPLTALFPMDEKLILFKDNSAFYITGSGPDATGANSGYSQPVSIATPVGCITQNSIVVIDKGLIFQSDKGIWLMGRNLMPQYIGAPVENYTEFQNNMQPLVISAVAIPDTTQLRFMLNTGVTLLYDYFFNQWSVFEGITAQSSTIYQGLHTFVDQSNNIFQETPGVYQDDTTPVSMALQTGWINVAGLQGYERFYYFYLLGNYYSPHTLTVNISYDYGIGIIPDQTAQIVPTILPVEQWRVFPMFEKCESFKLTITESNSTDNQGLSLSGLNMVVGIKKGYPVRRQNQSVGTGNVG